MQRPAQGSQNVIAVDLGGTHIRTAKVTSDGIILNHIISETPCTGKSGSVITSAIIEQIQTLLSGNTDNISGIGISSAGPIDSDRGVVIESPNMAFPIIYLTKPLSESFGLPVYLLNDCRAGALGELWSGSGKKISDFVYVTMSTGIGGGAVVDSRLLLGRGGNAGEIGHLLVDTSYNLGCSCGAHGHWEGYASGRYLPDFFRVWRERHGEFSERYESMTTQEICEAAEGGDSVAQDFFTELARINARGISNIIVAYSPERIILDGPLVRYHEHLILDNLLPFIDHYLPMPEITVSNLAGKAPLLGAAVYTLERLSLDEKRIISGL